jgi:single-strand DNA-binding protein
MNLNRAMIIGNLTRDPEVRTTAGGQNVASFSVATSYNWTDAAGQKQAKTEFHNMVAWGKLADICGQYLSKGKKVYVDGRLQTREWEAQDGAKKSRTEIVVENMIMLDRAGAEGAQGRAPAFAGGAPAPKAASESAGAASADEIRVEDIPF